MKETDRIIKLFEDLYAGEPWIDVTLAGTLQDLTAKQAAAHTIPGCNSIWELLNHIIKWRLAVLDRVSGKIVASPDHNFFEPVMDRSKAAWQHTLQQLNDAQDQWIGFLKTFKELDFEKIYPANGTNYYDHIHGIIQHDAYHLGQIVIMVKLIRKG